MSQKCTQANITDKRIYKHSQENISKQNLTVHKSIRQHDQVAFMQYLQISQCDAPN